MRFTLIAVLICANFAVQLNAQTKKIKSTWTATYEALDSAGKSKGKRLSSPDCVYERFGEDGKIREGLICSKDSVVIYRDTYTYAAKGNLTTVVSLERTGDTSYVMNYSYDDKGRVIQLTTAMYGFPTVTTIYTYGPSGALIKEEEFTPLLSSRILYRNSKEGKLLDAVQYVGVGVNTLYKKIYYDENGRSIKTEMFANGVLDAVSATKYDSYGNYTDVTYYDRQNIILSNTTYTYTYDSNGNWTRRVEFSNRKAVKITERTIVYY